MAEMLDHYDFSKGVRGKYAKHYADMQSLLQADRKRVQAGQGIPSEQFWKDVEAERQKRKRKRRPKTA